MPDLKVSFIVPVYNTERFLPTCLDSLLNQTYTNIEIVVVNDGSPDNAADVIADYCQRDGRIVSVSKPNGGLSSARNAGMVKATGDIIDFVDSDDYVEASLAQTLVDQFEQQHPQIVVYGAVCEPEGAASKRIVRLLSPAAATFEGFRAELLFSSNAQPYACRCAYATSFIRVHELQFAENVRFAEDVVFQFESYPLASRTVTIPNKLYHYVMRDQSLTHAFNVNAKRSNKVEAHLLMLHEVLERWRKRDLLDCCPAETITWILDLLGFDLLRMEDAERIETCESLSAELTTAFRKEWFSLPAKRGVRSFAQKVSNQTSITIFDVSALYLATRGLNGCLERFL